MLTKTKLIPDYPDYRVSNDGNVWSYKFNKEKKLKLKVAGKNYLRVNLFKNNKSKQFYVSRLVAEAFLTDFDLSLQVDHINGDKTNNKVENLRMVTNSQNHKGFKKKSKNTSSQYRGVYWNKVTKKWHASIGLNMGYFDDEVEAAKARDKKAIKLGFTNEALNFPNRSLIDKRL